ncbi:hypothetical protein LENED_008440 [Lentinula edodes]|uniref:DUF6534 domain-containing protein n=1 Tax=Lentinula edodes TaxID=5353 RepID=A0A1Q3EH79_LENED|nr:hypothetical protein LENED_008440 [Lentinula edodes]
MSSPSPASFTETWGCQLIAYMLDAVLYGVAMVLVGQYFYLHSGKDSKLIKGTIVALGSLGTMQFTFISHQMYIDYVTRFNAPASLDFIVFTAPRITSIQSGITALCDILITGILCYILQDSKSGLKRTNGMINKMIIYAINRGAVTSISALLNMILFVSVPNTFIFMIPLVPSCPLYVISVVSMLIVRTSLRSELGGGSTTLPSGSYALESHTRVNYSGDIHRIPGSAVLTFNSGYTDPTTKSDLIPNGV